VFLDAAGAAFLILHFAQPAGTLGDPAALEAQSSRFQEGTMLTPRVFACAVVLAVTVGSADAQDGRRQPPPGAAAVLVGLPVYTSDGREIGRVTEVVSEPQEPMLVAEIERAGAIGVHAVAIPIDVFVQRADRIELTLTFEQVSDRLAGPEPEN
jgi:hypothetical protein